MWFDNRSQKRKWDFEGEKISKHVENLARLNRKDHHQEAQDIPNSLNDEGPAEPSQTSVAETSLSSFKRIRFDKGLQALAVQEIIRLIAWNREQISFTDVQLRDLFREMGSKKSKWAGESRIGQQELYEAAELVLTRLRALTEHSDSFLMKVNKKDAPVYHQGAS